MFKTLSYLLPFSYSLIPRHLLPYQLSNHNASPFTRMEIIITSVIAFASTNIDDIFILTLFYGSKRFKDGEILGGQLLGIISLIAVSLIGSLAGLFIDPAYIGLLGLIPIYLGIKGILALIRTTQENEEADP